MLPGKKYTPEDVLKIARARIWYLLLPLAIVSAGTAVWARRLPNMYRSEESILVVPQRVPESYVKATVTTRLEDRLQSIQAQILSRTKLEQIINEFNLYPKERQNGIMEDIVQHMRLYDIHAEVLRGDAFRISYQGEDPRVVMKVTDKLGSLFIDENLEERSRIAESTSQFVDGQLEEARARLVEQEKKVEEYKLKHAGQLPSQLESNLQILQAAHAQLQDVMQGLNRERDRQLRLERDIADLQAQVDDSSANASASTGETTDPQARELQGLKDALAALQLTKKDTHPDVRKARAAIAELEQKIAKQQSPENDVPVSVDVRHLSATDAARRKRLDDMKLELSLAKRNIENGEREQQRLKRDIDAYQARNEGIPTRETEMTGLLRDYNTLNQGYLSLLTKREEARMAATLERNQKGEQFRLIDQARLPERPFSPNRSQINGAGAALGLGLGILLAALMEYRDRSFKTDAEVTRILVLPVLAVVPLMRSAEEQRKAFRRRLALGFGFATTVMLCMAIVVYTLVR
jgi:polysaccharide chain length determinant protein (PEP-CTERM system associated)